MDEQGLPFDQVVVKKLIGYNSMSAKQFMSLSEAKRSQIVESKKTTFLKRGKLVSRRKVVELLSQ